MSATIEGDENANELEFGDTDFVNDTEILNNDEVYVLLLQRKSVANSANELFTQTFSYVERTATTKKQEDLEQLTLNLRQKLSGLKLQRISDGKKVDLHKYEIACLANFIRDEDTSVEEILSLVPSMARFQLDQIELAIGIVIEAKEHATAGL